MARKKNKNAWTKMVDYGLHRIAHYLFFFGLVVAILTGGWHRLFSVGECPVVIPFNVTFLITFLMVLGLIVGLFNLTAKETQPFLIAVLALLLAGIVNLGIIPIIGNCLKLSLSNIVVFVVPGAIIVGMKAIWKLASD